MTKKKIFVALLVLGLVAATLVRHFRPDGGQAFSFRTETVTRGDISSTISATGTIEPEEVIDVGAQVAGQIVSFGKDVDGKVIDYGATVKKGMVLAQIDDSLYAAEASQAEAQVLSAKATIKRAEMDMEQAKVKLAQAERDWQRAQKIGPAEALSHSSYDSYKWNYEIAKVNVALSEASIFQSKATLAQAEATLRRAQLALGYCTIKSTVDGVIIDRRVNIGQTVVSSLNTPSLFLFAKDLKRMQVWVAVNEADIGKIRPKQLVTFTVDAFPGETFNGEVGKIRLNAIMTQNVVTYTVEVVVDNSQERLLPYLTANVKFELSRASNVLRVPNSALRWKPSSNMIVPDLRQPPEGGHAPKPGAQPRGDGTAASSAASAVKNQGTVWVPEGQYARPISVLKGLTDGSMTEVQGEHLVEGQELIMGVKSVASVESTATEKTDKAEKTDGANPFMPKLPAPPSG